MKKTAEKVFIIAFVLMLVLVPALSFVFPEPEFNQFEFRFLSALPQYDASKIVDTEYFNKLEEYFKDRIFMRTNMLTLNTNAAIAAQKPVVNDIVIGENKTLLQFNGFANISVGADLSENSAIIDTNMKRLKEICDENGIKLLVMGIPDQASMLYEAYPDYLDCTENYRNAEKEFFSVMKNNNIDSINMREVFLQKDYVSLYSRLDHHYNLKGAHETYREIIEKASEITEFEMTPLGWEDLDARELDAPFYGSRSRKLFGKFSETEKAMVAYPKEKVEFERIDEGKKVKSDVYEIPEEGAVSYNIYMGGDKAETIIKTNRDELLNALVIGDSFTNPIETFLYYNFNETRSLDFRYYFDKSINAYIKEDYKPDVCIYIRDDSNYMNVNGNGNLNYYLLGQEKEQGRG